MRGLFCFFVLSGAAASFVGESQGCTAASNTDVQTKIFDQCILGHDKEIGVEPLVDCIDPKFKFRMGGIFLPAKKYHEESQIADAVFKHIFTLLPAEVWIL